MEGQVVHGDGLLVNIANEVKLEEDEEDFCSCCEDEEELEDREETTSDEEEDEVTEDNNEKESARESCEVDLDEHSIKLFFKGISIAGPGDSDYLALMDGLLEAVKSKMRKVYAFTDSEILYQQIMHEESLDNPLLLALRQRILDHANDLEALFLKLVPNTGLAKRWTSQSSNGVVSSHVEGDESTENCQYAAGMGFLMMMTTLKCTHSSVLTALEEANALLRTSFTARIQIVLFFWILMDSYVNWASSSSQSENSCVDCPVNPEFEDSGATIICLNFVTVRCAVLVADSVSGTDQQTCQCAFWDEGITLQDLATQPTQQFEQWAWDSFESLPMMMDAYSDEERSQLAVRDFWLVDSSLTQTTRKHQSHHVVQTLMSMP
ncbi:hypothetical protein HAX54_032367 [Datura stramonium]|uniref:RNase H type-1 domain-containing protein n=1 Tax=Datura stramonium TaxID=4076 RepID=A0ABS8VBH7_DATST|nr:hypothetical protein [Datura stramonium]